MSSPRKTAIDAYVSVCEARVQQRLLRLRDVIREAAPDAEEIISYRMPAFRQGRILVYFAAFKNHIGVFPPVREDAALVRAFSKYMGPKGNLQFPHDKPVPFALIGKLVRFRVKNATAKLRGAVRK
ncbi:MAG: DUF1801 domain-containing protein [Micropepsaceae bacterium]